jgi:hypothetical protein
MLIVVVILAVLFLGCWFIQFSPMAKAISTARGQNSKFFDEPTLRIVWLIAEVITGLNLRDVPPEARL